jgi:tRNA A-37 threonylcarbamoyl transferase component Bud32
MQSPGNFSSLVNDVSLMSVDGVLFIRKKYHAAALGTGVSLPIERATIEKRVLLALESLNDSVIRTPKILGEGEYFLDMEYVKGDRLDSLFPLSQELAQSDLWFRLGCWLARMERTLTSFAPVIFDEVLAVQGECGLILNERKTSSVKWDDSKNVVVSLGDVGVRNIILNNNIFYLMDFEFCHYSRAGRDVGQLAAQLLSFSAGFSSAMVIDGYRSVGGDDTDVDFWVKSFKEYYGIKYG